jgi:hypothetical protein
MAGNTFEIQEITPGRIRTFITFVDSSTLMELHRQGLTDQQVLLKFNQQYYKHHPGSWMITFPREHKVFKDNDLGQAIMMALAYIYERDNPEMEDYTC